MQRTHLLLKKGWTYHPGRTRRGAKNLAWRPKIDPATLNEFVPLNMEHPPRRPNNWHSEEFDRLGFSEWPKEVGFFNSGDNFELTPEMMWRLFRKNHQETFWSPKQNEDVIVHLMPKVEQDPKTYLPHVHEVFSSHLTRFGADHLIYNAVMQAHAFAKDYKTCCALYEEMQAKHSLIPNAQTFVNLMLAAKLADQPRSEAERHFREGVRLGCLTAVVRLDTEFAMWMAQLDRMGSFTAPSGYLSVREEGAKPQPKNMWAIWGWDRTERKFQSPEEEVNERVAAVLNSRRRRGELVGTVYRGVRRRPWASYRGLLPTDWKGPLMSKAQRAAVGAAKASAHNDAPPALHNSIPCGPAY